jgi:hypothetical protein
MPTLPNTHARPIQADAARVGRAEAERRTMLMAKPGETSNRFPGDGGRRLPPSGRQPRRREA